jgi:preprotein translocase subunit SecA
MLSWLFGNKKDQATRGEDSVWMAGAARLKGIGREIERLAQDGHCLVVVAWTLVTFDELVRELEQRKPLLCRDLFGFDRLRGQLTVPGSVAIALANILSTDVKSLTSVPVDILVYGRNDSRAVDDAIVRFADLIGPNARVAFHLSLDDALLKHYIGTLKQLLTRLDVPEGEAISSPIVTQAIARAQAKKRP